MHPQNGSLEETMPGPGRKPLPRDVKLARGTLEPGRDKRPEHRSMSPELRHPATELPYDVAIVWEEYVADAAAAGARKCDADTFAEWCTMTANLRQSRAASGTDSAGIPPAAYLAQWRMLGELFGLAGPKSRIGQLMDKPPPHNAFTARRRPD
jgi:hypothetical protein